MQNSLVGPTIVQIYDQKLGADRVAHVVECLLSKQEALSS
jgi:hypothetical protein